MAGTPDVDVLAVQHDGALINALAVRGDLDAFADDPVAGLLVAWVESIDAGIDDEQVVGWCPSRSATPVTPVRHRGRAGLVAGVTAAVLVVSSGAAAAVTGTRWRSCARRSRSSGGSAPSTVGQDDAKAALPEPAAPVAGPNKLLADAQRALAQGDTEEAASGSSPRPRDCSVTRPTPVSSTGSTSSPLSSGPTTRARARTSTRAQGPRTSTRAQGKDVDQGQGKDVDQGQGKDVDQGKGKDVDQGQGKDVDQGQGKDVDQGTGSTQEPGTSASEQPGQARRPGLTGPEKPEESSDASKVKSGKGTAKSTSEGKSGGQKT